MDFPRTIFSSIHGHALTTSHQKNCARLDSFRLRGGSPPRTVKPSARKLDHSYRGVLKEMLRFCSGSLLILDPRSNRPITHLHPVPFFGSVGSSLGSSLGSSDGPRSAPRRISSITELSFVLPCLGRVCVVLHSSSHRNETDHATQEMKKTNAPLDYVMIWILYSAFTILIEILLCCPRLLWYQPWPSIRSIPCMEPKNSVLDTASGGEQMCLEMFNAEDVQDQLI